ncbi:MAG: nucleotidyl transferase AbiEii/AbiGii toxin family protein [Bacteroidetes bacterium]|nr:nucleotidyl transferase AbiEii/AbiGii toxin family protein [Bacteroidota bacterium]
MPSNAHNYTELYALQDKVLSALAGNFGPFYLTGGAALARFYLNHRYSPDLDLFANRNNGFATASEKILTILKTQFHLSDNKTVRHPDFIRLWISENEEMKIEMINNIAELREIPVMAGAIPVDTVENILANKINTLVERDNPKDLFDVACIASDFSFNWRDIFSHARDKAILSHIYVLMKLRRITKTFAYNWGGAEPLNVFELMGIIPPLNFDWKVVSLTVSNQVNLSPKVHPLTLDEIDKELNRIAEMLSRLVRRNDAIEIIDLEKIPSTFTFNWGGASINIVRKPIISELDVLNRLTTFPTGDLEGREWLNKPLNLIEFKSIISRIANDFSKAGDNSHGAGKTPLKEARPAH